VILDESVGPVLVMAQEFSRASLHD
jgi:hypothetical protein